MNLGGCGDDEGFGVVLLGEEKLVEGLKQARRSRWEHAEVTSSGMVLSMEVSATGALGQSPGSLDTAWG